MYLCQWPWKRIHRLTAFFLSGPVWVSLNHTTEQGSVYMLWATTRGWGWCLGVGGRHGAHLKLPATLHHQRWPEILVTLFVLADNSLPAPDYWQNNPIFPGQSCFRFLATLSRGWTFPHFSPEGHKQQLPMPSSSLGSRFKNKNNKNKPKPKPKKCFFVWKRKTKKKKENNCLTSRVSACSGKIWP